MKNISKRYLGGGLLLKRFLAGIGICLLWSIPLRAEPLVIQSFEEAVSIAITNDPWYQGNKRRKDAVIAKSAASSVLPDPKLSGGIYNLPVDDPGLSREAMTQLKLGISQMLPRGDSLDLLEEKFETLSKKYPVMAIERQARVTALVVKLWLEIYALDKSIALIETDRPLFEQLIDVAEASYSSARGNTRQQDVIRAQLELTSLEDRVVKLKQLRESKLELLALWVLPTQGSDMALQVNPNLADPKGLTTRLDPLMESTDAFISHFYLHPSVKMIEVDEQVSRVEVMLEQQKRKPALGVFGSYAYRDATAAGDPRSDFISIGMTIELPLFSSDRQDQDIKAAVLTKEALVTDKLLLVRKLSAEYKKIHRVLQRLQERRNLYRDTLLVQMEQQVQASLTGYTHDDGDFSEVVRSKIAQLNASLELLNIEVDIQKYIIEANYLSTHNAEDMLAYTEKAENKK